MKLFFEQQEELDRDFDSVIHATDKSVGCQTLSDDNEQSVSESERFTVQSLPLDFQLSKLFLSQYPKPPTTTSSDLVRTQETISTVIMLIYFQPVSFTAEA